MRKPIFAGNWKMNTTVTESLDLANRVKGLMGDVTSVDVVVCPPFPSLLEVSKILKGSSIGLGAQNMHWEPMGAYTGEVSAKMILTVGCQYVILGHSERRLHFGESDEGVRRKVMAALEGGLTPIVCLGERMEERESGLTKQIVERQLSEVADGLRHTEMQNVIFAYEPVWAIGTGKSASPEMANEVHQYLRQLLKTVYNEDVASVVRILYGGSVNEKNAAALLLQPDIDGALVGGASLKAESFCEIIKRGSRGMGG